MDKGNHLKRGATKSKIILELIESPLSFSDLKYQMKTKHHVSRFDVHYHLYDENHGLTKRKNANVITEKDGKLTVNLKSARSLSNVIGYLRNDPVAGSKIRYLFERAFLEAFLSNYGDRPSIGPELYQYLSKRSEKTNNLLAAGPHYFEEMNIKIGKLEKMFGDDNEETLVDILVDFARRIRGDIDIPFMLSYVLNVIEVSKEAEMIELDWKNQNKTSLSERISIDFSMAGRSRKEIMIFLNNVSSQSFDLFVERVIKESLKEPYGAGGLLEENMSVLPLYTGRIALNLFIVGYEIIDRMPRFMLQLGVPPLDELYRIISSVPSRIPPMKETAQISETLAEIADRRKEALDLEAHSISQTLQLLQDISGVTEEIVSMNWDKFTAGLDKLLDKEKGI